MANSKNKARLQTIYEETIAPKLLKDLKLDNINQVPKIEKIIVSSGIGKKKDDKRYYETVKNTLTKITGQATVDRMAKKSIANFKIRAGMNRVGISTTLRNDKMYEFLDRLINIVLPRVRDFHGVSNKSFDKSGNYNLGLKEQSVFPELTFEETQIVHGLQVTIVIKNQGIEQSKALLEEFGMPFEKKGAK